MRWGLGPLLQDRVVEPDSMKFRRWEDGSVIGNTRLVPNFRQEYDAPYYVVHRAHLHDALLQQAVKLGAEVHVNSRVQSYDPSTPSITLANGSVHCADLLVAADGELCGGDVNQEC